MQRTFNYTGRQRIEQSDAIFSIAGPENEPYFDVEFRIDHSLYPKDASLYVEAHCNLTRQRFKFGTVSKIVPPENRSLTDIDLSGTTLFTVLIVDESEVHGLLLASGRFSANISDGDEIDRTSILAVRKKAMEQTIWRLAFDTGGAPELYINAKIPNPIERMKSDPQFQSLILPAALRQVLIHFLWNELDEDDDVYSKWMSFATYFGGEKPEESDPEELLNWVEDVVSSFSIKFGMCDRLLNSIKEEI